MPKISRRALALTVGGVLLLGSAATTSQAQDARSYILATATTGGTYYPVGVALATLVKVKLEPTENLSMAAISSAGSGENVKLMRENQAQFSILQAPVRRLGGRWQRHARGRGAAAAPALDLDALGERRALRREQGHGEDRHDRRPRGVRRRSRSRSAPATPAPKAPGRAIMDGLGHRPRRGLRGRLHGLHADRRSAAERHHQGRQHPGRRAGLRGVAGVRLDGGDLTILGFTEEQIARANSEFELWPAYEIPADTYPGQSEAVTTIAQPNFLAVRDDIPEEDVYLITKTMYENLPFLQNIHAATKDMALEKALAGLPMPLHPGALRFYEEQGIEVPDRLKPPA